MVLQLSDSPTLRSRLSAMAHNGGGDEPPSSPSLSARGSVGAQTESASNTSDFVFGANQLSPSNGMSGALPSPTSLSSSTALLRFAAHQQHQQRLGQQRGGAPSPRNGGLSASYSAPQLNHQSMSPQFRAGAAGSGPSSPLMTPVSSSGYGSGQPQPASPTLPPQFLAALQQLRVQGAGECTALQGNGYAHNGSVHNGSYTHGPGHVSNVAADSPGANGQVSPSLHSHLSNSVPGSPLAVGGRRLSVPGWGLPSPASMGAGFHVGYEGGALDSGVTLATITLPTSAGGLGFNDSPGPGERLIAHHRGGEFYCADNGPSSSGGSPAFHGLAGHPGRHSPGSVLSQRGTPSKPTLASSGANGGAGQDGVSTSAGGLMSPGAAWDVEGAAW